MSTPKCQITADLIRKGVQITSERADELGVPATYRALLIELGILAPRSEVDTLRRQLRELQQQYDRDVLTPLEAETIINKDTPKIATWARVKEIRENALEKIRARAELARKEDDERRRLPFCRCPSNEHCYR